MTTMTSNSKLSSGMAAAGRRALQWRLLLLWIVVLLVPTAMLTVPLWRIFADQLEHSLQAADIARHMRLNAASDLMLSATYGGGLKPIGLLAASFGLLALPFLNGMVVTAARSAQVLGFAALIHGGLAEYWRMLRMMIVSLLPLAAAVKIGSAVSDAADKYAQHAILQSSAEHVSLLANAVLALLMVLALASVDAGRAQFAISTRKRSAWKAWWRGCKSIVKRPRATLGSYIGLTVVGVIVFAAFGWLRINVPHVSLTGFFIGLVLTQLAAAALAWMRGARLFALTEIAKAQAETGG